MLDDLPLADRLAVARDWFRRARSGEFPALIERHGDKFEELLESCHAAALQTERPAPSSEFDEPIGEPVYLPEDFRAQGHLRDMARSPRGKLLHLVLRRRSKGETR